MSATNQTGRVGVGTMANRPVGVTGDQYFATDVGVLFSCTAAAVWASTSLLNFQGTLSAAVGDSTDKTYYTYTLPANVLAAGKGIRITAYLQHTTGTANIAFRLSFGGTLTASTSKVGSASQYIKVVYEVFNITTSSQVLGTTVTEGTGTGLTSVAADTASVATTGAVVINATFNVANTNQITPDMFFVEVI